MNQSAMKLSSASPPTRTFDFTFDILNFAFPPIGVRHAAFIRMQGADAAHEAFQHKPGTMSSRQRSTMPKIKSLPLT
jgi:hypothetical protein